MDLYQMIFAEKEIKRTGVQTYTELVKELSLKPRLSLETKTGQ